MPKDKKVEKNAKKAEEKPSKQAEANPGKEESRPLPVADERTKKDYETSKEELIGLCQGINRNYFEIGRGINHVHENKLWALEFKNLEEFGEIVLEFGKSKLYQLLEIYKVFGVEFQYTSDTLQEKNWTKLRGLVRLRKEGVLNKKNVEFWIKRVAQLKGDQLQDVIAEGLGKTDKKEIQGVRMSFVVEKDQAAVIDRAINLVINSTGSESRGKALEFICADYLAGAIDEFEKSQPQPDVPPVEPEKKEGKDGEGTPY